MTFAACPKPENPPNGVFICDSETFSKGSTCALQCDFGYASVKGWAGVQITFVIS